MAGPTFFNSPIPAQEIMVDRAKVANPMLQREPYQFPDQERYPIRTVLPRNQREVMPVEQRLAIGEVETEQAARRLQIQGQELQQLAARKNFEYDQHIQNQAKIGMETMLPNLNPMATDFPDQVAEIQRRIPLAFQDKAFNAMIGRQWETYDQNQNFNRAAAQRSAERGQAYQFEQAGDQERLARRAQFEAAGWGKEELDAMDSAKDPMQGFAQAADIRARRLAQAEIAKTQNRPLTNQDYLSLIRTKDNYLKRKAEDPEGFSGDEQAELDILNDQLREFRNQRGITPSQPSTPSIKPPQTAIDYLKKNPNLREQFDQKYGSGAAKAALGE